MSENLTTIIISLITVLFGGGAWKFYEFLIKKKSEDKKWKCLKRLCIEMI